MGENRYGFYEFFAGGGMARIGLGSEWQCLLANEICPKKVETYKINFPPGSEMKCCDIASLEPNELPGRPLLSWASFPCQDLSLAGARRGLQGARSSSFWPFWRLMQSLSASGRTVPIVVLENVVGAITSNHGKDFGRLAEVMSAAGYRSGALVMDAVQFIPQSRPRLFIVAVHASVPIPQELVSPLPSETWHPHALQRVCAAQNIPTLWWQMERPMEPTVKLDSLIEDEPSDVPWNSDEKTQLLLEMMSTINRDRVRQAQAMHRRIVGTIYRRTRMEPDGKKVQRAEVRFDQISGCLRTPAGGSSRQTILVVEGDRIRSRLLSAREAARLMGVPDDYLLPKNYNEAYHLMGDGLVVPVVSWLERKLLHPLAHSAKAMVEAA